MSAERVLILDDEDTIRFVLSTLVSDLGHEAVTVGSIAEALSLIAEESFSCALLDLVLPDGSGIQVLEAIKKATPDTEVIIMTSHASVETAIDAIRAGAYDYIHKPFEIDVVLAVIARAVEKHGLLEQNRRLVNDLARQNLELGAAVKRIGSLHAAGMGMSRMRELSELLPFFLELVVQELEVDRASVMLKDELGELRIAAAHGVDEKTIREARVKLGEGVVGRVAQTGEPVLVDDVHTSPDSVESPRTDLSNSFISAPLKLSVPIKSNTVLGAINVTNRRSGNAFSSEDVAYLMGLAGQAAVAIERAQHFTQLQGAVESLETAREQLEASNRRLYEANAELEEAAELKKQFLANTSHELRTPLSGILGFLHLILDDICRNKEEEREFLEQAMQCAMKLMGLINDVLSIANIEAGKMSIDGRAIEVRPLFEELERVTQIQAAQKGLTVRFEVEASCVNDLRGDADKVKQVFLNLVGNAIKFTPQGGVTVRASEVPDLGHYFFEIVDTGIGIAPEKRRLLFEKFTQVDGSHTRAYGGTGLGLAISKCLVELMGGVIGVESAGENQGTRALFALPVWREGEHGDESEGTSAALSGRIEGPIGGPVVLIVEDDPTYRRYLTTVLHRSGYRTVEAAHAETAWVLVRRLSPAVVLIDYALAASGAAELRSGWDLAVRIDAEVETQKTGMIFISGFGDEIEAKLAKAKFARPPLRLRKPVDPEALVAEIGRLLGSGSTWPMRILSCGADPATVVIIRNQLGEKHYLEVASNGEECLSVLRAQPLGFYLLLLDDAAPQVDAHHIVNVMAREDLGADLPLVLLSHEQGNGVPPESMVGRVAEVIPRAASNGDAHPILEVVERYRRPAPFEPASERLGPPAV